jgi:nucleoside-diphosphate-sugar epimerase
MQIPAKVFITGANGFIGRAIADRFRALGSGVVGVDLNANRELNVHAANVAQPGDWQALAKGCELVIHTAAVVSNAAPAALYRSVSLGSARLAVQAAAQGDASRFLHLSSIAAYGLDFDSDRTESDDIALLSGFPYCDAKAASEHPVLAAHAAGEIACTIVRPGDVYGPGSRPWVLIPLEMMKKRQFLLPAGGRGLFSPVYIDNLLDGMVAAALNPAGSGQIFNITDGQSVPCLDFFTPHWRWAGHRGKPPVLPTAVAKTVTRAGEFLLNDVLKRNTEISAGSLAMMTRRAGYSIAKAERVLGYRPAVGLEAGLQRTGEWLLQQRLV